MNRNILLAKQLCDNMLIENWNEIKDDLNKGKVRYDDLDTLLTYKFLREFDNVFVYIENLVAKRLSEIKYFCRAAIGRWNDYERFIPKKKFKSQNRFNPPEEVFIYLGISSSNNLNTFNRLNTVEETCLKEIRAVKNSEASLCRFKVRKDALNEKVIDISIADKESFDGLVDEVLRIKKRTESSKKINREDAEKCIKVGKGDFYELYIAFAKTYVKMVSSNLFTPVNGLNRNYEYAPFHAFANYFRKKKYSGIIYKSTVNPDSKNIVLFNINDVVPIGEIKTIIYNDS